MSSNQSYEEKELLLRVAKGDEAAFEQLFRYHFSHLSGFAFSVTKSQELADDVVQDVFVNVWIHRQELPALRQFKDWLFIVTRNQAYKVLQREVKRKSFIGQLEAYFAVSADAPEQRLFLREAESLLHRAMVSLPRQQAQVFRMSRMESLSLDEIAEQLHLSKNTVKSHLTRALQGVRQFVRMHGQDAFLILAITQFLFFL